jgi:hypothetical protein
MHLITLIILTLIGGKSRGSCKQSIIMARNSKWCHDFFCVVCLLILCPYTKPLDLNKFWEEVIAHFPLIWHGPYRKRPVQQFSYCCTCISPRGNVFTEPLPSNGRGIHMQTHKLMGGIYEVRRWDGLRCHKDWLRHSKVDEGGDTQDTQTAWRSHKPTFKLLEIRKVC